MALGSSGCIKKMLLDGQIESTRKASPAINTLGDFEVARAAAFSSLGTLEGMHRLAPDNPDGLFLLTKAWAGAGFSFIEDDFEAAEDAGNEELAEYHRTRARAAYTRAIFYGLELLAQKSDGFEQARRNVDTMKKWMATFDESDVESLFWTGYAWIARVNVSKDIPDMVADLFIGVEMIERVAQLDETYMHGLPHVVLGAYHARTPMAELEEAKQHFERALQINHGNLLVTKFQYARTYHCYKNDKASYERLLREVVDARDPLPSERLSNTIAQRRAKRYLSAKREEACGF
jgi:tetratricopeptide (TPR) repeat protein